MSCSRGDWRYVVNHSKKVESIESDDIMRVAKKYFTPKTGLLLN